MQKTAIYVSIIILMTVACRQETQKPIAETQENMPENTDSSNIEPINKTFPIEARYKFEDFPVQVYSGKLLTLDFNDNPYASNKGCVEYMTETCESEGINFAGRFTILEGGCGTMCSFIIMADRKNGKFVTIQNPNGYEEEDGAYGYEYRKDSRLLIANANLFTDEEFQQMFPGMNLQPIYYVWENNKFVLLK